ncbi:MAG: hypothetical protein C4576_11700 [Desulfobacteraceae bacterium]|nr:MAG: hypothetical protein C4576_11700 [Desulfobacteraceae bacterium]
MSKLLFLAIPGFDESMAVRLKADLPNFKAIKSDGIWGKMNGAVPPNPVTAWTSALSGRNPGFFGFWGRCYRDSFVYGEPKTVDGPTKERKVSSLYTMLANLGQKVAIVDVPLTTPAPRIPGGYTVSTPLPRSTDNVFTWPKSLADEIRGLIGDYLFDDSFHAEQRDLVFKKLCEMDGQRLTLVKHFLGKRCDCVIAFLSGLDRLAHLSNAGEGEPFSSELREYYQYLDRQIGDLRLALDSSTVLLLASDHELDRIDGEVRLNEWLITNGYLSISEYPSEPSALECVQVEWSRTRAWAGNSGQIYVNLKDREAEGIVGSSEYESILDELISRLKGITDEKGSALRAKLFKRHEIYSGPFSQYAPDLFVIFENNRWRCSEKVGFGNGNLCSSTIEFLTGGYGTEGFFCIAGPGIPPKGEYAGASLLDLAPTVLDVMDLEIPGEMEGVSVSGKERTPEEEEALVQERLKFLGY